MNKNMPTLSGRYDSFQDISRHYRVALPVSEIAYIYDYMHLNSKNKLSGQAESPAVREDE